MGICTSCQSPNIATAKLIHEDGSLQQFTYPIKVSHVLQMFNNNNQSSYFICDSDEMDFDDVVYAISDDEVLVPGQLYFALPLSQLKRRLSAEEMAALAVKASSALSKNGDSVLAYSRDKASRRVADGGGGRRRRGKFMMELSVISE